jgi:hypothetical protein
MKKRAFIYLSIAISVAVLYAEPAQGRDVGFVGIMESSQYAALTGLLGGNGHTLVDLGQSPQSFNGVGAVLLTTSNISISQASIDQLKSFVSSGGLLISSDSGAEIVLNSAGLLEVQDKGLFHMHLHSQVTE